MSGYTDDQGFFHADYTQQQQHQQHQNPLHQQHQHQDDYGQQAAGSSYDMGGGTFPQDTQFQQFDYSQAGAGGYGSAQKEFYDPVNSPSAYTGTIMTPDTPATAYQEEEGFEDEPPLMEELGINFEHITQKTLAVLNPIKQPDSSIVTDADLAGPFVFCFAFGGSLLLAGKVQFGFIYGIGVVGCLAMYGLLTMMSQMSVSPSCIVSTLGYCLLPMVILSFTAVLLSLQGIIGTVLTALTVLWCSMSASKLFVNALAMDHQQLLVAYPCALVYGVFALLTVF